MKYDFSLAPVLPAISSRTGIAGALSTLFCNSPALRRFGGTGIRSGSFGLRPFQIGTGSASASSSTAFAIVTGSTGIARGIAIAGSDVFFNTYQFFISRIIAA